jgi:hypothetical protein
MSAQKYNDEHVLATWRWRLVVRVGAESVRGGPKVFNLCALVNCISQVWHRVYGKVGIEPR